MHARTHAHTLSIKYGFHYCCNNVRERCAIEEREKGNYAVAKTNSYSITILVWKCEQYIGVYLQKHCENKHCSWCCCISINTLLGACMEGVTKLDM